MGSNEIKRDVSRSHTIVIDDGEWMLPEAPPDIDFNSGVDNSKALAVRQPKQNSEAPRYGHLPQGFFG